MAKLYPMVSMAMDEEEQYDAPTPIPVDDKPDYPYELRIALTDKTMAKLGINPAEAMQGIGGLVHGHFLARITSASMNANGDDDQCCRVELQIEDLAIESEDEENAEADAMPAPKKTLASIYKTAS